MMDRPDTPVAEIGLVTAETVIAHVPAPLLVIDDKNKILFANQACEDVFGRAIRKIVGSDVMGLLQVEDTRLIDILLSGRGEIAAQEMRIGGLEHSIRADISISSIVDTATHRLISIFPRTGDRGHIAESNEAGRQQAMGAPAILGHEIKNPLAGIRGAAQLIARKNDEANQPLTELIITEVDRISRLLDQMQNLGGTLPPERSAENIHALIERAIRSVRAANVHIPIITISYDPSLPDIIINSDAMVQILINLLQNAADALEGVKDAHIGINTRFVLAGELREVPVTDGRSKSHRLPVEVTITDNGEGVPEHIVDEMFSPFVTTKREGQGLGLAIVRKMVQQMQCRVVYERDFGARLTAFKLYLPVAK